MDAEKELRELVQAIKDILNDPHYTHELDRLFDIEAHVNLVIRDLGLEL